MDNQSQELSLVRVAQITAVVLIVVWLAGIIFKFLGWVIHIALVVAIVLLIFSFVKKNGPNANLNRPPRV